MRVTAILVMTILVGLILGGCNTGEWSAGAAADYETVMGEVKYSPDANGGAGLMVLSGSYVPGDTDENVALGPAVEFDVGDVANAAVGRIVPGDWWSDLFEGKPARLFGTMAILWETHGGGAIYVPGTKLVLMPDWIVQPTITTMYFEPGSGADVDRGFKVLAGFDYRFKAGQ